MKRIKHISILLLLLSFYFLNVKSQETANEDTIPRVIEQLQSDLSILKKLKISGYIQAQALLSDSSSISPGKDATGKDLPGIDKNFQLRRGRIKFAYTGNSLNQYVMQFDVTENGFKTKDIYAKITDPFLKSITLTAGIFNRPWGYEIEYSSSMRESPERSKASTTLFPNERDLGAMLTLQAPKTSRWNFLKLDVALVTGNSVSTFETDKYKDVIARLGFSKAFMSESLKLSGDVSYYNGGPANGSRSNFKTENKGIYSVSVDTGSRVKRELYGADFQISYDNPIGITTLRGEYYMGQQPGTQNSATSQTGVLSGNAYIRNVQGYYVYFVQNFLGRHQLVVKYDVWDPNTKVSGKEIAASTIASNSFTKADIKYSTLGIGYAIRLDENTKFTVYYDMVTNESTSLSKYTKDRKDNLLTLRLQYKF